METAEHEMTKRPRSTPTFLTPMRPKERVPLKEIADPGTVQPKRLVFQTTAAADVDPDNDIPEYDCRGLGWSNAELRALMEFIMFHGTGESWPTHHRRRVWEAASFIKTRVATTTAKSGELLSCYILYLI